MEKNEGSGLDLVHVSDVLDALGENMDLTCMITNQDYYHITAKWN